MTAGGWRVCLMVCYDLRFPVWFRNREDYDAIVCNKLDAAIEAARNGFGVTRVLSYQISPHLASGELAVILKEYELPPLPVHIVHREGRYATA